MNRRRPATQIVAIVAIFAALNVVTDSFMSLPEFPSGIWYSWNFLMSPLTGIILGPLIGFMANFIGVMIGHFVNFIDTFEFMYTIGAPIGAIISALVFRGKWKFVIAYYFLLFAAYFSTPVAWQLPFWGMWDTYVALVVLLLVVLLIKLDLWKYSSSSSLRARLAIASFIGLEADVLFRIFLLIPCQTYRLFYAWDVETLVLIWSVGAVGTPIKAVLSTITTVVIGKPLVNFLQKSKAFIGH